MDSVTHLVLGAAIGELVLGKQLGKRAMLWGAFADTIPDLDVFFVKLFDHPESLYVHRGITHSLLFALLIPPVLGKLFSKFNFKRQASAKDWTILFYLGIFTHILIDAFTAYGTGWFEPFSHYRVAFNNIFVADPFYTLPFLVCIIALLILKSDSPKRKKWNRAGLIISTTYLLFTFINKWHVNNVFKDSLKEQNISYSRYFSTPTPLNNFLWMAVAEDTNGYYVGYYSDFDSDKNIQFNKVQRNADLLQGRSDKQLTDGLRWFANDYYCMTKDDSAVYFNDLRFGQLGGWLDADAPFAFSYNLNSKLNQRGLNRGKTKGGLGEAFNSLVKRIKGN